MVCELYVLVVLGLSHIPSSLAQQGLHLALYCKSPERFETEIEHIMHTWKMASNSQSLDNSLI
jgi:hypothetical protein